MSAGGDGREAASGGPRVPSFPNKMGRIVLQALEETMGRTALEAVLSLARLTEWSGEFPPGNFERGFGFDALAGLLQAMEEMYGPRSGRGLARRAGRACFDLGVRDFAPMLDVADLAIRVLPLGTRVRTGMEVLSETFNRFTDHRVAVAEDEDYFRWAMHPCGACWGRHTTEPCCDLAVGILEEGLFWLSGGKHFYVEEVTCLAAGDEKCVIQISKRPLD